jgi:Class II flagellar assembly regulator
MREVGRVATGGQARLGRTGSRGAGSFTVGAAAGAAAEAAAGAAAAGPVGIGLLALQEGGDPVARDRAARQRAESILEELQALQRDLLRDGPDTTRLERLAVLEAGEDGADPILREAVRAIVLRARVELARRGWNETVSAK